MQMNTNEELSLGNVMTVKIARQGQMKAPKQMLKQLHLEAGSEVSLIFLGNGLLLLPQQTALETLCEQISQTLAKTGKTEADILATLPEIRHKVFKELYGEIEDNDS